MFFNYSALRPCQLPPSKNLLSNRLISRAGIWLTLVLVAHLAQAQTLVVENTPTSPKTESLAHLRPLNTLLDLALQNAPSLRANAVDTRKQALAVKVQRNSWGDVVWLGGSMLYGNGTILDANTDASNTQYLTTDRRNTSGNVSLNIRISGGDVLNRHQKTEIQRLQMDRIGEERAEIQQKLRLNATAVYYATELALQMAAHKANAIENLRLTLTVAEKYFREGNLPLDDYTTLLSKMTNAEEQLSQAESEAKKQVFILQELVGDNIWQR